MPKEDKSIQEKVEEFLNEKNFFTDGLALVESKTGVPRKYLLGGCFGFILLYVIVGYASSFIVNLIGFLYPAYASVKAIESSEKDDDTQWLTYWVVYAAFSFLEYFSDLLLSWFPFYFLFKVCFLGWCMAPFSWNGAELIYHKFLKPFIAEHEKTVDDYLARAKVKAEEIIDQAEDRAKDIAFDAVKSSSKQD